MEKGGVTKHTGFCHTAFAGERGVSELCRAVRAAGRIICDRFFAVGALSDFLWRSFREEVVDLLDGDKEDESNDQEINDCIQEFSVRDDRDAELFCFGERGDRGIAQRDEKVGEIDTTQKVAQRRHDDMADQRRNDLSECSADDYTDCHVYYIASEGKVFEFFEHTHEGTFPF